MHNSLATVQCQVALGNWKNFFQVRIQGSKGKHSLNAAISMSGNAQAGFAADCHATVLPGQWFSCLTLCACPCWTNELRDAWLTRCSANCR